MRTNHIFEEPATGVEDILGPDGEVVGKTFIAVDKAGGGDTYRIPMSTEIARRHGSALLGIGKVDVVDQLKMGKEISKQRRD